MEPSEVRLEELFYSLVKDKSAQVQQPEHRANYHEIHDTEVMIRYVAPEIVNTRFNRTRDREALLVKTPFATVHVKEAPYKSRNYELNIMIDSESIEYALARIKEAFHQFGQVEDKFKGRSSSLEKTVFAERFGIENVKDMGQLFHGLLAAEPTKDNKS